MPWRDLNDDDVDVLLHGHIAFQMLACAHELGLFDYLSTHPGAAPAQVANALDLDAHPFDVLLGGLRALGLVTDRHGALRNAPAAQRLLTTDSPDNRTALLGIHRHLVYPGLGDLLTALQEATNTGLRHFPGPGDTLYGRLTAHPELERVLHDGLHALSRAAIHGLITCDALADRRHLVDIGGGDGSNALALAEAYPDLTVTVVDQPSVLELAAPRVRASPQAHRVRLHAADFLTDPLPTGADAVLLAHVLPIFPPATNKEILVKIHDCLAPGGQALVFNTMQHATEDGPIMGMLFSAYFLALASGQGRYYPWTQIQRWLADTGFTDLRHQDGMPYFHALCTGTKQA